MLFRSRLSWLAMTTDYMGIEISSTPVSLKLPFNQDIQQCNTRAASVALPYPEHLAVWLWVSKLTHIGLSAGTRGADKVGNLRLPIVPDWRSSMRVDIFVFESLTNFNAASRTGVESLFPARHLRHKRRHQSAIVIQERPTMLSAPHDIPKRTSWPNSPTGNAHELRVSFMC